MSAMPPSVDAWWLDATEPKWWKALSAGLLFACVGFSASGSLQCFQAGPYTPATNLLTGTYRDVTVGEQHMCGLRPDGKVACWGANDDEQATPPRALQP